LTGQATSAESEKTDTSEQQSLADMAATSGQQLVETATDYTGPEYTARIERFSQPTGSEKGQQRTKQVSCSVMTLPS